MQPEVKATNVPLQINPRNLGKACARCGGWRRRHMSWLAFAYCSHQRMGYLWPHGEDWPSTYYGLSRKPFAAFLSRLLAGGDLSIPPGAEGWK